MSNDLLEPETQDYVPPPPKKRTDDELDMTPMVDVTFLLLIFFMVTAAFALQKVLEVPKMSEDEAISSQPVEDLEKDSIVVRIDADNVFWIGAPLWSDEQKAQSSLDMRAKVREARDGGGSNSGPNKMMVHAHEEAVYEKLVDALDAGSAAGINEIRLSIDEDHEF